MNQNEKQFDTASDGASSAFGEEVRKKLRWALLSALLAVLTIHAASAQWKGFSFAAFLEDLRQADWRWMLPAVLAMLGFIVFEALAIRSACQVLPKGLPPAKRFTSMISFPPLNSPVS